LTESLLLASLGCLGGVLLAAWSIDLIVALSPGNIPRIEQVRLDRATLLFVAGLSFLTALIFGLAPALQFSKPNLSNCLKESSQTATGSSMRRRLRGALVVSEIALALVLLVGAGLLVRSFFTLLKTDPGFAADKLVALQTFIWDRYGKPEERAAFVQQVTEKMKSVPGVQAVGVTTALPFFESSMDSSYPFTVEGRPAPPAGQEPTVFWTIANNDYFAAMGVSLLRGRLFTEFDKTGAPPVVLINETMARRHFRDEDPVGRKIVVRGRQRGQAAPTPVEIIGVVGDVRHESLDKEPRPEYFQPHAQAPNGSIIFAVRTNVDPMSLLPTLKARIWEVNATQPIYAVSVMADAIDASLKSRRFSLWLLCAFASLALALAMVGIYGVMSYATTQRTHEIGVRMALGAAANDILKLVLRQGMRLTIIGVGIGLASSFALTRLMSRLLYGVSATDPLTFVAAPLLLAGIALLACYVPARRATKVDPMIALRRE
jgi:putative ABC transport system permease protein